MKVMHKLLILLFSSLLILLIGVSSVSALDFEDADSNVSLDNEKNHDITIDCVDVSSSQNILDDNSSNTVDEGENVLCSSSSSSDNTDNGDVEHKVYRVNHRNFKMYFEKNVLKPKYGGSGFIFDGEFNNMGVIKITSNNTIITGVHSIFNNTAFNLDASGIVLSNITMVLDKSFADNNRAGIFVHGDNITIYNCIINYTAPKIVNTFGIYCDGHKNEYKGLNILNNTINFSGVGGYKYAVLLRNVHDSIVYGNKLDCDLPLKFIPYYATPAYGSVSLDTVAVLAADYCENLTLSNNYIRSNVIDGVNLRYPTLDTVVLYGCSHSLIENNTIISEDFLTQKGQSNYLQALDLYNLDDITIIGNNISVITSGGNTGTSTAYPIQINGPVQNAKIAFNRLTTYNHGPNCGIYSQNFYGDTYIDIISNFINVTGEVDRRYGDFSLLSGIEVQDTSDNILNNTIIVNNLGDYDSMNHVYGISYIQNTGGSHTYNIQFNNITTNGNKGVKLIGKVKDSTTQGSTVSNNVINTKTTSKKPNDTTDDNVESPEGTDVENNTNGIFKHQMSSNYYPDWLKNYLNNGGGYNVPSLSWVDDYFNNDSKASANGTDLGDNDGNGDGHWNFNGNSKGIGYDASKSRVSGRGNNTESILVKGESNPQATAPGVSSVMMAGSSSASPSDSGSSPADNKAYEITKQVEELNDAGDYIKASVICLAALLLLIVGYKRQKDKEEEKKY